MWISFLFVTLWTTFLFSLDSIWSVIGTHNHCKTKKLTNMRSAGQDVLDVLQTPVELTLEFGLDFIAIDELMEVTPKSIRLRKADLNVR